MRVLLAHKGRENAIAVPKAAEAAGLAMRHAQDVVKALIEEHGVPVGSSYEKPAGWYLVATDAEREENRTALRSRALSILRRAKAFDPRANLRLAEIFQGQLPLFGGARG